MALRDDILMETTRDMDKENYYKVRNESCLRPSLGDNNSSAHELENRSECLEEQNGRSMQVKEVDRRDDVSSTSMVDSPSALGISPDDVVEVIGEKQFWKAKRAIINQQRAFAVQVFELHRLLKVQKLIAKSPHLLSEDSHYIDKPSLKGPRVKRLQSEYGLETPLVVKTNDHSAKPDLNTECADENAVANLPHSCVYNDSRKGLVTQASNYFVNEPPAAPTRNIKPSPWCFPPTGNQWLVSVMAPSEGFIYKPYIGPCPPTAGFVAPFYGSRGPICLNPVNRDFLNTAYGILASHHQGPGILPGTNPSGQTCFPPFSMAVMNPSVSGSAVEQMSLFPGARSKDDHFSMVDINFMTHQNSHNMSSQMSQAISRYFRKFQASKESEAHGSTASSPSKRATEDALPLFPMEPIVQASDNIDAQTREQQTQVIKVVPYNSRLATESAAQIFQSIQEERKHYD